MFYTERKKNKQKNLPEFIIRGEVVKERLGFVVTSGSEVIVHLREHVLLLHLSRTCRQ